MLISPSIRARTALVFFLSAGVFVRCECEDAPAFRPGAEYDPEAVLDFGTVSVRGERTLPIDVISNGGAAYSLDQASSRLLPATALAAGASGVFRIVYAETLNRLSPGQSAQILVTYRPCPEAWEGGWSGTTLRDGFDFSACSSGASQATLELIDNTRRTEEDGAVKIELSGLPGAPPVLELGCLAGSGRCGQTSGLESTVSCVGLTFGEVAASAAPCDLFVELRNVKQNGQATADLEIERLELKVRKIGAPGEPLVDGPSAGFEILDASGAPLAIDPDGPLRLSIPPGQDRAVQRILLRYRGSVSGTFVGTQAEGGGLRVYSNDPVASPAKTVLVSGTGVAPDIAVLPPGRIRFPAATVGVPEVRTATVFNNGDAPLEIRAVRLQNASSSFTVSASAGTPPFTLAPFGSEGDRTAIQVQYTARSGEPEAEIVEIESNDPDLPVLSIPVSGGSVPQIAVDPSPTLVFPLDDMPAPEPRTGTLRIDNVGSGPLVVRSVKIVGPDQSMDHSSVDDFAITGCSENPCSLSVELCAPTSPGCLTSSTEISIRYQNNDVSQTDLVTLTLESNDPVNGSWVTVLSAEDRPCLFPNAVATVQTMNPRAGEIITVDGRGSTPGSGTRIDAYRWSWLFTPGSAPGIMEVVPGQADVVSFVPPVSGLYILGLSVANDCGAASQGSDSERISVAAP